MHARVDPRPDGAHPWEAFDVDGTGLTLAANDTYHGNPSWFGQTSVTHDGVDAVAVDPTTRSTVTHDLSTTVTEPVKIAFSSTFATDPAGVAVSINNQSIADGAGGDRTAIADSDNSDLATVRVADSDLLADTATVQTDGVAFEDAIADTQPACWDRCPAPYPPRPEPTRCPRVSTP